MTTTVNIVKQSYGDGHSIFRVKFDKKIGPFHSSCFDPISFHSSTEAEDYASNVISKSKPDGCQPTNQYILYPKFQDELDMLNYYIHLYNKVRGLYDVDDLHIIAEVSTIPEWYRDNRRNPRQGFIRYSIADKWNKRVTRGSMADILESVKDETETWKRIVTDAEIKQSKEKVSKQLKETLVGTEVYKVGDFSSDDIVRNRKAQLEDEIKREEINKLDLSRNEILLQEMKRVEEYKQYLTKLMK